MSTRVWESAVIRRGIEDVWKIVRPLKFSYLPVVDAVNIDNDEDPDIVGNIRSVIYTDGTVQKLKLLALSDTHYYVSWEVISSEPELPYLSISHTIRLRRITELKNQTFIEWDTILSNDAPQAAIQDQRFKQLENFEAIEKYVSLHALPVLRTNSTPGRLRERKSTPGTPNFAKNYPQSRRHVIFRSVSFDNLWRPKIFPKTDEEEKNIRDVLADNLLFKHLKEAQLKILVQTMFKSKFKQGEYIIKQGSDGDNFYVVSAGTCGIYKKPVKAGLKWNPSDIGELVYEPKRGDSFGELALLHSAPRVATVVAKTDVELWTVDQRTFTRLLRYLFTKEEPEQLEELPEAEEDDDSAHGQNSFAEADEEEA